MVLEAGMSVLSRPSRPASRTCGPRSQPQTRASDLGTHVGDCPGGGVRASPRTWWPAPMSSGTTAEPIQPEAPEATLAGCLQAAFAAAGVAMTPQQRAKAAQRVLVVAANSELQERGLLKHARIARSITAALRERGADELTARLGAEVGMLAFRVAIERWMQADHDQPFPLHAAAAFSDLQVRAAELDSRSRLSA